MTAGPLDRLKQTRIELVRQIVFVAVGVSIFTFQLCGFMGIRINTSPSLPLGLYVATSDPNANLIEFCPAEPFASLAIERGYRNEGTCPDGAAPLLKPVAARPGDVVELSARGIEVNGRLLSDTAPLPVDTKGRRLPPWKFGRYTVKPGSL